MNRQLKTWATALLISGLGIGIVAIAQPAMGASVGNRSDRPLPVTVGTDALSSDYIRPRRTCPEDLEALVTLMLNDLPGYINRELQRARDVPDLGYVSHVIIAGRPEYEPLSLGPGTYTAFDAPDSPEQIFFTTLERQYVDNVPISQQHFHWLFLTETSQGWQLVLLFSRFGGDPPGEPPSPPTNTSQGAIAQAIRVWLRDCQAGAIAD